MTKTDALKELKTPTYPIKEQETDLIYVTKRFGFTSDQFAALMNEKPKTYIDYPNSEWVVMWLKRLVNWARSKSLYPK